MQSIAMTIETSECSDDVGAVHHASGWVWCLERGASATVSVVERNDAAAIRFVLWCSLRGCGECSERCLAYAAQLRRHPVPAGRWVSPLSPPPPRPSSRLHDP